MLRNNGNYISFVNIGQPKISNNNWVSAEVFRSQRINRFNMTTMGGGRQWKDERGLTLSPSLIVNITQLFAKNFWQLYHFGTVDDSTANSALLQPCSSSLFRTPTLINTLKLVKLYTQTPKTFIWMTSTCSEYCTTVHIFTCLHSISCNQHLQKRRVVHSYSCALYNEYMFPAEGGQHVSGKPSRLAHRRKFLLCQRCK